MKGKRRERLMALALIFAMTAGMIAEPVRISAAQEYSSKVSEQNGVTEAYTVSGQILSLLFLVQPCSWEILHPRLQIKAVHILCVRCQMVHTI